jgi:Acetoacetate decarboxylase (ADC)
MTRAGNPFNIVNLHGEGTLRGITVAMPTQQVLRFLPAGLSLGPQTVTPPGTHPVILSYNSMYRAVMSVPTLLPTLTYNEFTLGVPFTYTQPGALGRTLGGAIGALLGRRGDQPQGPYYYMPLLYLDSVLATMGGLMFWGYAKKLARFKLATGRYAIDGEDGAPRTSMEWQYLGEAAPQASFPYFNPVREMLDQAVVSQLPAALGPLFVVSEFNKDWSRATLRPLATSARVDAEFVPGFGTGSFPATGESEGIDTSVLGSYELNAPWILGLPHAPVFR